MLRLWLSTAAVARLQLGDDPSVRRRRHGVDDVVIPGRMMRASS